MYDFVSPKKDWFILPSPFVPDAPFLMFLGGRERVHWKSMGEVLLKNEALELFLF